MARFLFATVPFTGHVNPGLPIAAELVKRGHDVRWHSTERFRPAIERIGARHVPFRNAPQIDEAGLEKQFPERGNYKGLNQLKFDLKHIFMDMVPGALADLEEELKREPADVVVGDSACGVCGLLHERHNLPWAVFGITVFSLSSRDTAPFGLALMPNASPMGRLRNRALQSLTDKVIFKESNAYFAKLRNDLGFRPTPRTLFDFSRDSDLYLQACVEEFEYPRSDLPTQVRYTGVFVPQPPAEWTPPSWWSELDSGKKVVLVTQGTIANDYDDLIRPAIRALANEDVLVIATTGSRAASEVRIDPLPKNVRVEQFVPYAHLMPKVDLLLTNGGYGSIQIALAHGVPVIAYGASEEKPEIANRVTWSGVGLGFKAKRPKEEALRHAVRQVLGSEAYRQKAQLLKDKIGRIDAARRCGNLLEELAARRPSALP